ncbi:cysteine-rich receptor-like protein kinase 25 [Silene latifolia]|uniref:cysteine-rich receptor-like protein kinase 25 n=1 Tax=Silene latifolia TaxID=37657 RepID=UPI003D7746D7
MGSGEDQVYALFYCKGDVDQQTCQDCIEHATRKIKDVCKFWKEGIVWFEECTLRYANRTIFSIEEVEPNYSPYNKSGYFTEYLLDPYNKTFYSTKDTLIQKAAGNLSGFAAENVNLSSSLIMRVLVQCTPDIVGPRCYNCLAAAFRIWDTWDNNMVFLPSCLFMYDVYKIVAPPAPTPESSLKPNRGLLIPLIAVVSVVFLVLAAVGGICLWKRCSIGRVPDPNEDNPPDQEVRRVQGLPKYTFVQVEKMTKGFKRQLGKGAFGVVYHGRLLDGSREVAVKMLNETDAPTQFSNEIDVFARICHNNLVSLLGYCEDGTKMALIYEYMENGDLRAFLSEKAGSLSWTDRLKIAIDTAEGLHYLHKNCEVCIVHRDVKPANILLNQHLQAKVADFGLSKIFPEKDVTTIETRVIGTHGYKAPEYSETGLLNEKADVYSFGVVLLELITGIAPRLGFDLAKWFIEIFNQGDIEKVLDPRITRANEQSQETIQVIPDEGSVWGAIELARTCVEKDGDKRPVMWEIVVKLKVCLDMEVKKNAHASTSTTEIMMGPLVSSGITMSPEPR